MIHKHSIGPFLLVFAEKIRVMINKHWSFSFILIVLLSLTRFVLKYSLFTWQGFTGGHSTFILWTIEIKCNGSTEFRWKSLRNNSDFRSKFAISNTLLNGRWNWCWFYSICNTTDFYSTTLSYGNRSWGQKWHGNSVFCVVYVHQKCKNWIVIIQIQSIKRYSVLMKLRSIWLAFFLSVLLPDCAHSYIKRKITSLPVWAFHTLMRTKFEHQTAAKQNRNTVFSFFLRFFNLEVLFFLLICCCFCFKLTWIRPHYKRWYTSL